MILPSSSTINSNEIIAPTKSYDQLHNEIKNLCTYVWKGRNTIFRATQHNNNNKWKFHTLSIEPFNFENQPHS